MADRRSTSRKDGSGHTQLADSIQTEFEMYSFQKVQNFRSFNKIWITPEFEERVYRGGEEVKLPLLLANRYEDPVRFNRNIEYPVRIKAEVFHTDHFHGEQHLLQLNSELLESVLNLNTSFTIPEESGTYYLRVSLKAGWLPASINSHMYKFTVQ